MRIAYLGWGSLIWNPGKLKICGSWNVDGPKLPIEFARISDNGRLTLVICPGASKVATLWAQTASEDLSEVIRNLAERENASEKNIGFLSISDHKSRCISTKSVLPTIHSWAKRKNLDCVVWTDLRPNINYKTLANALDYLRTLEGKTYHMAKEYICNTPQKVQTKYRKALEKEIELNSFTESCERFSWLKLRKDLKRRTFYRSSDDSYWAAVPDRPATFGHVILVSWRGCGDQDITDCGLFRDPMHIADILKTAHDLTWAMKNCLTSNGKRNGKKCEKVYVVTECETSSFPFHFHLIPRFEGDNAGNMHLLEMELEEARWMRNENQDAVVQDGKERIEKVASILKHHNVLLRSQKWALPNGRRENLVNKILQWWLDQEGTSPAKRSMTK